MQEQPALVASLHTLHYLALDPCSDRAGRRSNNKVKVVGQVLYAARWDVGERLDLFQSLLLVISVPSRTLLLKYREALSSIHRGTVFLKI